MAIQQKNSPARNQQDSIRIQDLLYLCLGRWRWFVISLAVCLGVAVWYLLATPPVYTRTASILVKDDSKGKSTSDAMDGFADFGMFTSNTNVNNEMGTLKSPDLMREVVSRLSLETDYHVDGRFHRQTVYGDSLPVRVSVTGLPDGESAAFILRLSEGKQVSLSGFERDGEAIDRTVKGMLGDSLRTPVGVLVVAPASAYSEDAESEIYVSRKPLAVATADYASRLSVSQNDEKSNIIDLSFRDVSPQRAEDVLNTLIAVYNENWVKDKNQIAVSTSMFISERLGVIEGELGNVDNDISSYKSAHLLPDVQAAASMYMTQVSQADASIKELNNQAYMARYIRGHLSNDSNRFQLLPTNSGIDNPNIAAQITEYNSKLTERNSLVAHSSTKNPLVVEMDASLSAMRSALLTAIDNQLVALNAQIRSQQSLGGQATSRIASNPQQSKYLLSVERQQKVKESLYLYLLQKREENELSQAFTAYNTRIVTMPGGSMIPTAPVRRNILLVAFTLGLLIPVVIIFICENMNTKVRGRKDLEGLSVPFIGEIPLFTRRKRGPFGKRSQEVKAILVKEGSRNVINEAFRVLRTNLEFMAGEDKASSVIIVTSFNAGSGKSFLTMNIAISLAIKGKRVLVVDGDLRHASVSSYVGSLKPGLSDYLGGHAVSLADVIYGTEHASMDIMPVGTIPPNPTELLFGDRLGQAIDAAREQYDYVFIDCPPVEIVADTPIIEKHADRTVFVIRAGLLERGMLAELEKIYGDKKYKNMSVVLNGTERGKGRYGYQYGYGTGYHYGLAKDDMGGGVNGWSSID